MRNHLRFFLFCICLFLFCNNFCLALDGSRSDRESIITAKSGQFYKAQQKPRQFIGLSGSYDSDYNSKDYELLLNYYYRSNQFIHDIFFNQQTRYSENSKKTPYKSRELYDVQLSSKMLLFDTNHYFTLYQRSTYDEFSTYYYDVTNAVGFGHIFFDRLELDVGVGDNRSKVAGYNNQINASLRLEVKLSDKVTLMNRSYVFFSAMSQDYESRTRLSYPINNKLDFTVTHNFEKHYYRDDKKNRAINQTSRSVLLGIKYSY